MGLVLYPWGPMELACQPARAYAVFEQTHEWMNRHAWTNSSVDIFMLWLLAQLGTVMHIEIEYNLDSCTVFNMTR